MEQGGFDDLFRSANIPAVNNPFEDGDNPFADVPSRASDPWASFYAQQAAPQVPSLAASVPLVVDSRPEPDSVRIGLDNEDAEAPQQFEDQLPAPDESELSDPPTRTSTLSPPFREVYEEDSPTSDASVHDLVQDVTIGTDDSIPVLVSPQSHTVSGGLNRWTSDSSSSSTPPQRAYGEALPPTHFDSVSASLTDPSSVPPAPLMSPIDRKSTTDLISSLLSETSSPSSPFRKSAFKPPPTPRKRPLVGEKKTDLQRQPAVSLAVPPVASKPEDAAQVAMQPPVTSSAPVVDNAAHAAAISELVTPAIALVVSQDSVERKEVHEANALDIGQAAATPLPPSVSATPTYIATPKRASTPSGTSVAIPDTASEPLSPPSSNTAPWTLPVTPSADAFDEGSRGFVSPLETASSARTAMDRTTSDLTLPGMDEQGWYGDMGTTGTERWASENGVEPYSPTQEAEHSAVAAMLHHVPASSTRRRRVDTSVPNIIVTVGDPQKVGDPISAHIVYTVHTNTEATALFRKTSFSVLRRYSDFLWLFETLQLNNPGIIVPPVPEKHSFGRFEEGFVESRRQALNRCIQKIVDHPLLYGDPALKMFLESDSFALDIKHRKAEVSLERASLMASIGNTLAGPKFVESDEWFENRRAHLDALESQLRALVKTIDVVAKHRADVAAASSELSESLVALAGSSLNRHLSHSLATLADLQSKAKDLQEAQSKDDVLTFLSGIEEYTRLIGSIRLAFTSREKVYLAWQTSELEVRRTRTAHEKAKKQGKLPSDRSGMSLAEVAQAERRALDSKQEFESVTKLIKSEFARFEDERIEDFKDALSNFVEHMIRREAELIALWEHYQGSLTRRAGELFVQNGVNA